jgi:SAM-dependent methyltransferase
MRIVEHSTNGALSAPEALIENTASINHLGSWPAPHCFLRNERCPACGNNLAAPFYDGGRKPLAMIAWPASRAEAQAMPRLPLEYVRCLDCEHIYNAAFSYDAVPYVAKPNLMFNRGANWTGFLDALRKQVLAVLPQDPTVVEIGHGDGHFLAGLAETRPQGRYVGFDPHGVRQTAYNSVFLRAHLFDPAVHVCELMPDLIVSRHVLEHLTNPLGLLQGINFAAGWLGKEIRLLLEVPCADRAVESRRLGDFYYEHFSQFTTQSFRAMLRRANLHVEDFGHGYNHEVVYALLRTQLRPEQMMTVRSALQFGADARTAPGRFQSQLAALCRSGQRIAIWGGVGKCAAFLNTYELDADRFPLVVDSDAGKVGTYVPGTGQKIQSRAVLADNPVGLIIIPAQWRAKDIVREISEMGLQCTIMLEHEGVLVDYFSGDHPYRD